MKRKREDDRQIERSGRRKVIEETNKMRKSVISKTGGGVRVHVIASLFS